MCHDCPAANYRALWWSRHSKMACCEMPLIRGVRLQCRGPTCYPARLLLTGRLLELIGFRTFLKSKLLYQGATAGPRVRGSRLRNASHPTSSRISLYVRNILEPQALRATASTAFTCKCDAAGGDAGRLEEPEEASRRADGETALGLFCQPLLPARSGHFPVAAASTLQYSSLRSDGRTRQFPGAKASFCDWRELSAALPTPRDVYIARCLSFPRLRRLVSLIAC